MLLQVDKPQGSHGERLRLIHLTHVQQADLKDHLPHKFL